MTATQPLRRWQCQVCGQRYTDEQIQTYDAPIDGRGWPPCHCKNARTGEPVPARHDEDAARHLAIEARGGKLLTLPDCPRCHQFHEDMVFERITPRWGWQGTCPETGEAVHLSVTAPNPGLPMPSEMTADV